MKLKDRDGKYVVVFVTTANSDEAEKIAQNLVDQRLAACVNIVPEVRSIYRWQGKIETDTEAKIMIKTRSDQVKSIITTVKDLHSYDVCEITVVPIIDGNPDYFDWIDHCVKKDVTIS